MAGFWVWYRAGMRNAPKGALLFPAVLPVKLFSCCGYGRCGAINIFKLPNLKSSPVCRYDSPPFLAFFVEMNALDPALIG